MTAIPETLEKLEQKIIYRHHGIPLSTSEMRELIKDILDLNEDRATVEEYKQAFRSLDAEKINFFLAMGENARQQVMNIHEHRKQLEFGFTKVTFGQYGWINKPTWNDEEIIYFDKQNYVRLARGNNSLWTYGVFHSYSLGGSAYSPSVFGDQHKSKEQARFAALTELQTHFDKIIRPENRHTKKDVSCANQMIKQIKHALSGEEQLTLF